jgi:DNA invertase Pin-like site-specific DNA recombinase
MSTDYQRYSIENQAAVIAAYAQLHDLSIVRTYRDEGESGLKLKNRAGLKISGRLRMTTPGRIRTAAEPIAN